MCDKPKFKRNACRWGLKIQNIYFHLIIYYHFLHKKADITDRLKQHLFLWRNHDTCFIMKMKWEHVWRWDRYRNKDCEKETRKWEKSGREQYIVWNFSLKLITLNFLLVYWVHQREMSMCTETCAWLPGPHDDKRSTDILWGTAFFNMRGGKRGQ